jgi:hypothetical protein
MNLEDIKARLPLKERHDEKWYVAAEVDRIIEAMAAQLQASQEREAALRDIIILAREWGRNGHHWTLDQKQVLFKSMDAALSQAPTEGSSHV